MQSLAENVANNEGTAAAANGEKPRKVEGARKSGGVPKDLDGLVEAIRTGTAIRGADKGKRAGRSMAVTVAFEGDAAKWLREQARINEREIEGQVRWCVRQAMKAPGPYSAA